LRKKESWGLSTSLIYLIRGSKEWTKDWKTIQNILHKRQLMLIKLALREEVLTSGNFYDLLHLVSKTYQRLGNIRLLGAI